MSNLLHHIYFIQNIINKGPVTDDTRLSNRLIAHALKQARSRLLKNRLDKNESISENNFQRLCISLVKDKYHDCDCVQDNSDCYILKSTNRLPNSLTAKWGSSIDVLFLNGIKISNISNTTNNYSKYSITNTKPKIGYFIQDGYLYILNNHKLKHVLVRGIWEDPEEANEINDCANSEIGCNGLGQEVFPIDSDLTIAMYQMALEILEISYRFPEDNKNDTRSVEQVQALEPNETSGRL